MAGWVNYDDVVSQLRDGGLILDKELRLDNAWQTWRVEGEDKERRGRSILREWSSSRGESFIVGVFGVWHGNAFDQIKIDLPNRVGDREIDADERAAMATARKVMLAEAEKLRKQQAKQCAQWSGIVWAVCIPPGDHPYLINKGIGPHIARRLAPECADSLNLPDLDEANTARLNRAIREGSLAIPMHDEHGRIKGLQFIGESKTFWPTGMAMASTFGVLGPFPRSGVLLLTEGYATAATAREASGYPVAYAFSAGNLDKAATQIRKAAPAVKILILADDDYLTDGNPGCTAAARASAAVSGCDWLKPDFLDENGDDRRQGRKLTDFNDLAKLLGGLSLPLAQQINRKLDELKWRDGAGKAFAVGALPQGGGESGQAPMMPSLISIDQAAARYWNTYGLGGQVLFDEIERRLVHVRDVQNLLPPRSWDLLKTHPNWRTARDTEIGFDPTERDPMIRCNLFGGWPTVPKPGKCEALLDLLRYLCSNEGNGEAVFDWVCKWLAYPIQHPGAKMHSALIVHGPQGTGKSRFFEAYGQIFGPYFRVLGQEALEDKFNADWAEKKLFILADEVLARQDMYHVKNRLKGFITGESIRVNPKNVAAHTERNHMNIVFLSNERQPIVIENDDRRHLVIYVPPKLTQAYFEEVNEEIAGGGIEALHYYLRELPLGDFRPWSMPPMTRAKQDLQHLGASSEERFVLEWLGLELENSMGDPLPVGPVLGSHLYKVYETWCERNGERKRGMKDLINLCGKRHGWVAGASSMTHETLTSTKKKNRKMIIPSDADLALSARKATSPRDIVQKVDGQSGAAWLTAGYFAFAIAAGLIE